MANPSQAKGTSGEVELKEALARLGIVVHRTSPGMLYDLARNGNGPIIEALAGRADRRDWYVTIRLADFAACIHALDAVGVEQQLHIESKRYARISWHAIFEKKFGGKA